MLWPSQTAESAKPVKYLIVNMSPGKMLLMKSHLLPMTCPLLTRCFGDNRGGCDLKDYLSPHILTQIRLCSGSSVSVWQLLSLLTLAVTRSKLSCHWLKKELNIFSIHCPRVYHPVASVVIYLTTVGGWNLESWISVTTPVSPHS